MRAQIEAHYGNSYLTPLALAWGKFLEPKDGLLARWRIDKVSNQHQFYDRHVRPWLEKATADAPSSSSATLSAMRRRRN